MTPDQMREARALLGWTRRQLSARSDTSFHMVKTLEQDGRLAPFYSQAEQVAAKGAISAVFEVAGVKFTDGDAPNIKLRKPDP